MASQSSARTPLLAHVQRVEDAEEAAATASGQRAHGAGMSVLDVCFMQIAIILGLGVLGLSYAFASLGWILGLLMLLLSAAGALYSGVWIAAVVRRLTQLAAARGSDPPRKYSDLGLACYGNSGRVLVQNVQYTFLGGALVAVQLVGSTSLMRVVDQPSFCFVEANVVVAVAMILPMQIQHLRDATWAAFLGVAMIIVPAVTARLFAHRLITMLCLASVFALASAALGHLSAVELPHLIGYG